MKNYGLAISNCLSDLGKNVEKFEEFSANFVPTEPHKATPAHVELQKIDRLRQALEDLSQILENARVEISEPLECAKNLQLEETRNILLLDTQARKSDRSGDLDLF